MLLNQLVPHRGIEHAGVGPAGLHESHRRIVGARIGHRLEGLVRVDAGLQQEVPWHQVAGGRGRRAEDEGVAFEVGQRLDRAVGGDELAGERGIFLALDDGDGGSLRPDLALYIGKAAQPRHVDLAGGQRFDHRSVVRDGHELHLHAGFLLQVVAKRRKLALQFGGGLVGNGRDLQDSLGTGEAGKAKQGQRGEALKQRQHGRLLASFHRSPQRLRSRPGERSPGSRPRLPVRTTPASRRWSGDRSVVPSGLA
ncbi:hypothetical protein D9M72_160210 [compost metagenome]